MITLRRYQTTDLDELTQLFYDTILTVNRKDYSLLQVTTWANQRDALLLKDEFFRRLYTLVATEQDRIVGYGNIDSTGYLDHLYVHKNFQRRGVAGTLLTALEEHARTNNVSSITVHASITARPFFEKKGFLTVRPQTVTLKGVSFLNYVMEKHLSAMPFSPPYTTLR